MSAGMIALPHEPQPTSDLAGLAPRFYDAVQAAVSECRIGGLDVLVYETYRSLELQELYYARGRTIIPPDRTVTNARSNLYSWHGYGLAVDVISRSMHWDAPDSWFERVAVIFKKHGCDWGGDWKSRDTPHFQWGKCKPTPSDEARKLFAEGGLEAVWKAVGATYLRPAGPE